jgi:hypothetical protein
VSRLIHGKDFIRAFALITGLAEEAAEALLFLGFDENELKAFPNIRKIVSWLS